MPRPIVILSPSKTELKPQKVSPMGDHVTQVTNVIVPILTTVHSAMENPAEPLPSSSNAVTFALFNSGIKEACEKFNFSSANFIKPNMLQMYTNRSSEFLSPECRGASSNIGDEPIRSILRHQRLMLLGKSSDELSINYSYRRFTEKQPSKIKLTLSAFKELQAKFQTLTKDQICALSASAVLKPSVEKITEYASGDHVLPQDSEQMLTEVTRLASQQNISFMPAITALSNEQQELLEKCFPANAHFRHFLFAENGLKELSDAVASIKDASTFEMWEWRWWIDLMGFDREQHGITQPLFERANQLFAFIREAIEEKRKIESVMPAYFSKLQVSSDLSSIRSFKILTEPEKQLVTQIVAYFEQITPEQCQSIIEAFNELDSSTKASLISNHDKFLVNMSAQSPTYLPAVVKTAHSQFKAYLSASQPDFSKSTRFSFRQQGGARLESLDLLAMKHAAKYTFELLKCVYEAIGANPTSIVNARNAAYEGNWDKNDWATHFIAGKIKHTISENNSVDTNIT